MKRTVFWVSLLFVVVFVAACGRKNDQQRAAESSEFMALATRTTVNGLTFEQREGKALYDHYCAVCHGKTGAGDGFNAFTLKDSFGVELTDLKQAESVKNEAQLRRIIESGGSGTEAFKYMPPWGGTFEAWQIQALVSYIRTFAEPPDVSNASSAPRPDEATDSNTTPN